MSREYLGIDVGGTNIKYAVLDENYKVISEEKIDTQHDKELFLTSLTNLINQFPNVEGVGISMPGFIHSDTGYMATAGALFNLYKVNLVDELRNRGISKDIHVENDAKCATISEMASGNAVGIKNFMCITVGTGIGGGIVIDGKLLKGNNFAAGEVGLMRQLSDSDDIVAAITGIYPARRNYAKKHNVNIEDVDGKLALSDKEVADYFYKQISRLIYNMVFTLNPELILLGGAISQDDKFIQTVKDYVAKEGIDEHLEFEIDRCKNINLAGLIGAVYELRR